MTTTAVTIQDLARMLRELRRESCEPNFDAWLRGEAIDEEFASLVQWVDQRRLYWHEVEGRLSEAEIDGVLEATDVYAFRDDPQIGPSPVSDRERGRQIGFRWVEDALWFEDDLDMFIEDGDATEGELQRRQVIDVVHAYCRAQDEVADPWLDAWRSGDAILARLDHVTRWTRMRKVNLDEVERLLTDDEIEETLDVAMAVMQYSDEWIDERPSIPHERVAADRSG